MRTRTHPQSLKIHMHAHTNTHIHAYALIYTHIHILLHCQALKIVHRRCVDTAVLYPHPRGYPLRLKLKTLAGDASPYHTNDTL